MKELTDKMRRWLQKNGTQKVRVTWCNGFVDSYVYEAKQIDWTNKPGTFCATHVEKGD